MITLVETVAVRIRVEWGERRSMEADVGFEVSYGKSCIWAKPEPLIRAIWDIQRYQGNDPDRDAFENIARAIIEYMTTGRHLEPGRTHLNEGPVQGVGQISLLADQLRMLSRRSLMVVGAR